MPKDSVVPISESLSKALERLFKAGGFALAFGFGGMVLIVFASLSEGVLKVPIFTAGCLMTFVCLFFFVFSSVRTRQVTDRIKDDLPLLDTLQLVALQVADLASLTQSLAFKHLLRVQKAVETVSPMIESLPIIGPIAKNSGLTDAARISGVIVEGTETTKEIVVEMQKAIRSGDLKALERYASKLEGALSSLKAALKADSDAQPINSRDATREVAQNQ